MNDNDLRLAVRIFQNKHGSPIAFMADKCGISREHFSRWLNNNSYVISSELKTKIKSTIKGEM